MFNMTKPVLQEEQEMTKSFWNVKRVAIIAIFIALSAVGALIKIPSPIGTIGLDSAPGFFAALAFGSIEGMIVIGIGHILSAAVIGFPLSIPIHIFIACQMAVWALAFRYIQKKFGYILAVIAATLLNGVISAFTLVLVGGIGMAIGVMPFLALASGVNIIIAALAHKAVSGSNLI
jgi:uncharacterized membrane protein